MLLSGVEHRTLLLQTWVSRPMRCVFTIVPPYGAVLTSHCLLQDLQRILTRSLDLLYSGTNSPSGLQMDSDYLLVITTMETQILAWQHEWANHVPSELSSPRTLKSILNCGKGEGERVEQHIRLSAKFYFSYAMLIVNSFGLQNALERSAVDIGHFFARCHSSAVACATVLRDEMGPQGFLRYATDSTYVMASYAVLSLLKVSHIFFPLSYSSIDSSPPLHSYSDPSSKSSSITRPRS